MPPVRTSVIRAARACESCRRGKQRCHATPMGACLRCTTLRLQCSLPADGPQSPSIVPAKVSHDCMAIEERVTTLERAVAHLSQVVGLDLDDISIPEVERPASARPAVSADRPEPPLQTIHDVAPGPEPARADLSGPENIIDKGILAPQEVEQLLSLFRPNYGRWIALRETEQPFSNDELTHSPILLCACCLIAIRHSSVELATATAPLLFDEARRLLSEQLLKASPTLSYFKAVILMSLWSTTIGQKPLSMDSWLISGYAVQQGSTIEHLGLLATTTTQQYSATDCVGKLLLWTRLCLAHLHACVSMRRPVVLLTKHRVEQISAQLQTKQLTNYETRMVAEVCLYWTLYECTVPNRLALTRAQAALREWRQTWSSLLHQPRSQFLQLSFHFAELLLIEQALSTKSAAARQSMLSEMTRLCRTILQLVRDTADERTIHLSDHIYHITAYAAITLSRLLCKYADLLQSEGGSTDLDYDVVHTVQWLRSLGSSLHIGHIMGDVIDKAHRKLRPQATVPTATEIVTDHALFTHGHIFPDMLGFIATDTFAPDWDAMIPDWDSIASEGIGYAAQE